MTQSAYWRRIGRRRLSRRGFLRASAAGGVGAGALALVGCGGDDDEDDAPSNDDADTDAPNTDDDTSADDEDDPAPHVRPASPVTGGVVHLFARLDLHDRWDPHRSRSRQTQVWQSLMYNRLIRWSAISAGTLEGDLADLPEQPDDRSYVFTVRPTARYWDDDLTGGRAVTADDVRINIERQIEGLDAQGDPDPLFFRQGDYIRTAEMDVTGERSIVMRTEVPDVTYLPSVHAGPWAWITSPEGIETFGDNWRSNANNVDLNSGTGPYVPQSFVGGSELILRRSTNWWKPNTAFPDGWNFRNTPTAQAESAYRTATIDMIDFPLDTPAIERLRDAFPDHPPYELPLDTPVVLGLVSTDDPDNPLRDPRLARALGLAVDRFELIERLYFGDGRISGPVPWFFDGWAVEEETLLSTPGYRADKQDDVAAIDQLVDAAAAAVGGIENLPIIPIVVPDLFEATFPGIADTLRQQLEANTGLSIVTTFGTYDELEAGLIDGRTPAFFGWLPLALTQQQADPTANLLRVAHTDGPQNWGRFTDADVDALLDTLQRTADTAERQRLALQVQDALLDNGYWLQHVTNGIQLGLHQPYLVLDDRTLDFAWSAHHLDKAWVDTTDPTYPDDRALPEPPPEPEDDTPEDTAPQDSTPEAGGPDAEDGAADGDDSATDGDPEE